VIRTVGIALGTGRGGIERPVSIGAEAASAPDKEGLAEPTDDLDGVGQGEAASASADGPGVSHPPIARQSKRETASVDARRKRLAIRLGR
jgi:hypothetical protein